MKKKLVANDVTYVDVIQLLGAVLNHYMKNVMQFEKKHVR